MASFSSIVRSVILGLLLQQAGCDVLNAQELLGPLNHETNSEKVLETRFGFDISWRDGNNQFTVQEALSDQFNLDTVTGLIALVRGDPKQSHSAEVLVRARSSEQSTLDCLEFANDKSALQILTSLDCFAQAPELHIDIIVAVRPWTLQFGSVGTHIESKFLDIVVWRGLDFETYALALQSRYGDITCQETSSFVAHALTVASQYGRITGNWSLLNSISFSTIDGTIDLDLPPKWWSSGPSSFGAVAATSKTGNITIRMPFEPETLSLRNMTANITTDSGAVQVELVHGAETHIQTVSGSINATLLPHWAFYQSEGVQLNYITTMCDVCDLTIDVLTPAVNYYDIPPLLFSRSRHVAGLGKMALAYPKEWAGVAEWTVGIGVVNVSGEDYEVVKDGGLSGKIQRRPLGSKLFATVRVGTLDLTMKG